MKKNTQSHFFTLVEILTAVAVLVIMMSFIFEFTNAAQRLWGTNTGRTEMSAQADSIFTLINEDLENIYVVSPDEDIDAQAGWYCMHGNGTTDKPFAITKGYNLKDFCFFTQTREIAVADTDQDSNKSFIHPVRYHFEMDTTTGLGKLYRFENDNTLTWSKISYNFFDKYKSNDGADPTKYFDFSGLTDEQKEDYLLADNIQCLQIFSDAGLRYDKKNNKVVSSVEMPIMKLPQHIRVTISFAVSEGLRGISSSSEEKTGNNRAFSRVFLFK